MLPLLRARAGLASATAIADFERYPRTFGPSPVHPLENLSLELTEVEPSHHRFR